VLRTPNTTREAARAVLRGVLVWQFRIGLGVRGMREGGKYIFPARPPALGMLGVVGGLEVWNWGGAGYTRAAVEK